MRPLPRWKVLVLAIVGTALTGPGQTIGVSVFVDSIILDLDLSRSQVSGAYLVGTLIGAVALPTVGRLIDRYGVGRSMVWIGVAFGFGIGIVSQSWSLVTLAVGFTLIRMFGQGSLTLVNVVAVTKAIAERRGAALGVLSTVGGAMLGLVPLALNRLVEWTDWRTAWLISGAVVLVTVPSIGRWGFGYGTNRGASGVDSRDHGTASADVNRSGAIRTYRFWVLGAASAAAGMFVTALNFQQISLLGEAGLTPAAAAAMFIPQVLGTAAAGYLFGWLSDRWSSRVLLVIIMGMLAGALALTVVLKPGPLIVVYSVLLGMTGGSVRAVGAAVPPRWFGIGFIGAIQGFLTFLAVFGSAAGPLYLSLGRDITGEYSTIALYSTIVPALIALAALRITDDRPVAVVS